MAHESTIKEFWFNKLDCALAQWKGSKYEDTEDFVLTNHLALKRAYHHIQALYDQNEKLINALQILVEYIKQKQEEGEQDSNTQKIGEEISTIMLNESEAVGKLD